MAEPFTFPEPLIEGVIERRRSQFTMQVVVGGESVSCHCPTTNRIGDIDLGGRPCLLSKAADPKRKTPYTVEAVSLNRPMDADKSWIGINQNAANRYVEHYLANGGFSEMVGHDAEVRREVFLGESKLDFLVDGCIYLEVKTPLISLQVEVPEWVRRKKQTPFDSTGRMVRHVGELAASLGENDRAILLTCFIYDNPGFQVVHRSEHYEQTKAALDAARAAGVETWQANFELTPEGVELRKCFPIEV